MKISGRDDSIENDLNTRDNYDLMDRKISFEIKN